MVVFTCTHCGESLQKPKVEKHYFKCRKTKSLTCVDCLKDFHGEEYVAHTKCVTEEERYSAKGTFAGGNVKKGEVKQESWVEMIKSIVEREKRLKPSIRDLLKKISTYTNVPRKKTKFINFIKNTKSGHVNDKAIEEVWDIIEKYKSPPKQNDETDKKRKIEADSEAEPVEKKPKLKEKKKKKNDDSTTFSFKDKITKIVSKKGKISKGLLRKQVLRAYGKATGIEEIPKETIKQYITELREHPDIVIIEKHVSLK